MFLFFFSLSPIKSTLSDADKYNFLFLYNIFSMTVELQNPKTYLMWFSTETKWAI